MNGNATGFVDVNQEPLHQELISNSYFRVYRAVLTPGKATEYHRHFRNTLYIVCKGGRISTQLLAGSPACPNILPKGLPWRLKLKLLMGKWVTGTLDLPPGFLFYMPSWVRSNTSCITPVLARSADPVWRASMNRSPIRFMKHSLPGSLGDAATLPQNTNSDLRIRSFQWTLRRLNCPCRFFPGLNSGKRRVPSSYT